MAISSGITVVPATPPNSGAKTMVLDEKGGRGGRGGCELMGYK